jgi:hypothetical protein
MLGRLQSRMDALDQNQLVFLSHDRKTRIQAANEVIIISKNKVMSQDIQCLTFAYVPLSEAYKKIADVSAWWATNVTGSSRNVGDQFTVRFGKTHCTLEVAETVPGQKIIWRVVDAYLPLFRDPYEWTGTTLMFEMFSDDLEGKITFTHQGIVPGKDCYEDCTKGWTFYVTRSLQQFLQTGKGMPGTGIFARVNSGEHVFEGLLYFKNDPVPLYEDGYLCIDVKGTNGEEVIAAHSIQRFDSATFQPQHLNGEYYMVLKGNLQGLKSLMTP